jgi:hypothetical protein
VAKVRDLEGVDRVTLNREEQTLLVRYDPDRVTLAQIHAAIEAGAKAADEGH